MPQSPVVTPAFRMTPSLARALRGEPVRVGSENPAKLGAVRTALAALVSAEDGVDLVLVGAAVASGVPDQPVGWDEIVAGARHRAEAAFAVGDCVLAVGIEDGLVALPIDPPAVDALSRDPFRPGDDRPAACAGWAIFNVGCAWVTDGIRSGTGFSSAFVYPPAVARPAFADRRPIGDLFDALWAGARPPSPSPTGPRRPWGPARATRGGADPPGPSGRQGGNIGQLTQGRLDRSAYGAQAILCALVPFLHADLYD
ncbi:MAG: inosine/xanthosine triphosphatase [Myxococcota bacterium]